MDNNVTDVIAIVIFSLILLVILSMYIYCVIHVHRNPELKLKQRSNWITFIVIFPVIGPIAYLYTWKWRKEKGRSLL